jgi:hypothetical protein
LSFKVFDCFTTVFKDQDQLMTKAQAADLEAR